MKPIQKLLLVSTLVFSAIILVGGKSPGEMPESVKAGNTVVVLNFKTQPDKGAMAVSEFMKLLEKVKQEPNFVRIRMHVDPNDPTSIMLYEEWEDADYYKGAHMNTQHLKAFQANSRNFLAGPPEISFWEVEEIFE